MKKITLLFCVASTINAISQPVIVDGTNIPLPGLSATFSSTTPTAGIGSAGTNQTWDFSTLSFSSIGTYSVIIPFSSPIGSSFPTANFAWTLAGTYSFFNVTSTKMEAIAYTISSPGSSGDMTPNPKTNLKFPFNYLDAVTDTYQQLGGSTNSVTLTYDGYGTLITPTKTYLNAVRIKEDYGPGQIDYQWYILNPLMAVMAYDHNSNTLYSVGATQVTGIENNKNSNASLKIYPNPTAGNVEIETNSTEIQYLTVADINGNNVFSKTFKENTISLNLSHLCSGVYNVSLISNQNVINKRLVITK